MADQSYTVEELGWTTGRWSVDHGELGALTDALLLCDNKGIQVSDCNDHEELEEVASYLNELEGALAECLEAFRLTREYVGESTLPEVEGWSWFDAVTRARRVLDD